MNIKDQILYNYKGAEDRNEKAKIIDELLVLVLELRESEKTEVDKTEQEYLSEITRMIDKFNEVEEEIELKLRKSLVDQYNKTKVFRDLLIKLRITTNLLKQTSKKGTVEFSNIDEIFKQLIEELRSSNLWKDEDDVILNESSLIELKPIKIKSKTKVKVNPINNETQLVLGLEGKEE